MSNPIKETFCMKYQILFSRKNKKNILKCHLLKFLPSMLMGIYMYTILHTLFESSKNIVTL